MVHFWTLLPEAQGLDGQRIIPVLFMSGYIISHKQFWTWVVEWQLGSVPKEQSQAPLIYCWWHSHCVYPILLTTWPSPNLTVTTGMTGRGNCTDLFPVSFQVVLRNWGILRNWAPTHTKLEFHSFPTSGLKRIKIWLKFLICDNQSVLYYDIELAASFK